MNENKLRELGFKLIDEYVHGDNSEFVTRTFKKRLLIIDLDFDKKTGKYLCCSIDIDSDEVDLPNLKFSELKQLDKILNKKL